MKMKRIKKALSLFLCMVLIVAMALFTTGCNDKAAKETVTTEAATTAAEKTAEEAPTEAPASEAAESEGKLATKELTVLGEGSKSFEFFVADLEGNETWFEIHTDEETVGAALLAVELIAGDAGPYGLYVKTVNGITADYDKDKVYWAFYVNDDYGMSGVDATEIEDGKVYSFRIAK